MSDRFVGGYEQPVILDTERQSQKSAALHCNDNPCTYEESLSHDGRLAVGDCSIYPRQRKEG